jgi:NADH dehydrogenase FAD-containing subunit
MRASPIARIAGLATDPQDRVWVDPNLRSISHAHILAVGDAAHPIAPTGAPYRLSALAVGASGAHAARVILAQKAEVNLEPFSFSTMAQAVAIGRLGVFYLLDRNDGQIGYIIKGRTARRLRDLGLLTVAFGFKLERRFSGSFFMAGRNRVSWPEANDAIQKFQAVRSSSCLPRHIESKGRA